MKVWVTRDEPLDGPLCTALIQQGLEPVLEPVVRRCIIADLSDQIAQLDVDDWLVLTSPFAIETIDPSCVRCRVAVVGEASRKLAQSRGLRVERTSPDQTGRGLFDSLNADPAGARHVLYPRSSKAAPPDCPSIPIDAPVLYETSQIPFDQTVAQRTDVVILTSPSAAQAVASISPLPPIASIGPTTTSALRARGIDPWLESPEPNFPDLAAAIAATWQQSR